MKKKLKKPSIKTVNHRDGGMSFYAEGGELFPNDSDPNILYAAGGSINPSWPKPTATDSLNLYNNAVKVLDYYRKNDSYKELPPSYNYKNLFLELNKAKKGFDDKNKKKEIQYPTKEGRSTTGSIPSSMYYEKLSPYQFKQREAANSVLDTRSPMSFYDLRISPSAYYDFSNENENDSMRADQIGIYGYDPIAIKPDKLLTPAERKLREKRYGKPKSINDSKVVEEIPGPKVVREIPAPLNPAYKPRTTGIPFLLSDEVVNTTTPMTPSVPVAPITTTSKTPMTANPTKWFSLDGSGNKVLIDNQYLTRDEFEKFKVANPNFNYSQKPDSVGRKYNMGGGIELSNRMFEEGGEYELTNEEIRDLQSRGYDIELL